MRLPARNAGGDTRGGGYAFGGYHFRAVALPEEALTHPSVNAGKASDKRKDYERLEFLGDAVLGLAVAELLLELYPEDDESALARRHARLVSGDTLADIASAEGLGALVRMSRGEEKSGGRANRRNLENVAEAMLGAIYLEGGFAAAREAVRRLWTPAARALTDAPKDPKTALQEYSQAAGLGLPVYTLTASEGPSHAPSFTAEAKVGDASAQAEAGSKKAAERAAAEALLTELTQGSDI